MNSEGEKIFLYNVPDALPQRLSQKMEMETQGTPTVNLENVGDLSSVCRICATITQFIIPIFEGEGQQNSLGDKMNKHLPIQVLETDELPRVVCYQCASTLLAWHELVECCIQSDVALRTKLAAMHAAAKQVEAMPSTSRSAIQNEETNKQKFDIFLAEYIAESTRANSTQQEYANEFNNETQPFETDNQQFDAHISEHATPDNYENGNSSIPTTSPSPNLFKITNLSAENNESIPILNVPTQTCSPNECNVNFTLNESVKTLEKSISSAKSDEGPMSQVETEYVCKYCNTKTTTEELYKEHLVHLHSELLFHCDECNKLIDRKELIIHMSWHAMQLTTDVKKDKTIRTKPSEKKSNKTKKQDDKKAQNISKETISKNSKNKNNVNANSKEVIEKADEKQNTAINITNSHQSSQESKAKDEKSVTTFVVQPNIELQKPKNNFNLESDFSDHSETEDGFGPLPDSVFEAIMDSQEETYDFNSDLHEDIDVPSHGADIKNDTVTTLSDNNIDKEQGGNENDKIIQEKQTKKNEKKIRTCPMCGKEYTASSSYFYHIKYSHILSKQFLCEICQKKFSSKASLTQHMTIHSGELNHTCTKCSKSFRSRASLYIHTKSLHSQEKPFKCTQCNRCFTWKQELLRHTKRHAKEKRYVCAKCNKGFNVKWDLVRHEQTHTYEKPYTCDICKSSFSQRRYLKVHFKNYHSKA